MEPGGAVGGRLLLIRAANGATEPRRYIVENSFEVDEKLCRSCS